MLVRTNYFWLSLLLAGGACGPQPAAKHPTPPTKPSVRRVEIDRDDSIMPAHLASAASRCGPDADLPHDTVTRRGNFVRYLLTEDSCCADNVYLRWGNARFSRTYIMPRVRRYRSYFTPQLEHQSEEYLILEHGCATGCGALLFLPLDRYQPPTDVQDVVGYDPQSCTVVYCLPEPSDTTDREFLRAVNIRTGQTKPIRFKHRGVAAEMSRLVGACRIDKQNIYLKVRLYDDSRQEAVTEELTLPNDIR